MDVVESGDLESSVQGSLMEAELQEASATRSAVELSLDEDKVRSMPHAQHSLSCNHLSCGALSSRKPARELSV